MRVVDWTDDQGYNHKSLVRSSDPDSMADLGIRQDPPDVNQIDWEGVKKDLHNALLEAGIVDWRSYQSERGIHGIILGVLQKRIRWLFRMEGVQDG